MKQITQTSLGIFLKYPQFGHVKTRLAASIGENQACEVYKCFVADLVERFCVTSRVPHGIAGYSPADEITQQWVNQQFPHHFQSWPQPDGDLGHRMAQFFEFSLSLSTSNASMLIGTDSPHIPWDYLIQADEALQDHDCVIGPSEDGGYYLIGLSRLVPELFENLPWSQPDLFEKTMQVAENAGISVKLLPLWYDVDTIHDLTELKSYLLDLIKSDAIDFPRHTWEMIQSMEELMDHECDPLQ